MKYDEKTRILLSLIHSLFCKADHDNGDCNFYDEIELGDCWRLPAVSNWVVLTQIIMLQLKLSEEDLIVTLQRVSRQLSSLSTLTSVERRLFDAIYREADLSILISEEPLSVEVLLQEGNFEEWSE